MTEPSVGILAYGSLINKPDWEIEEAIVGRKTGVLTPFSVEFARESVKRSGAPTLVPVTVGGSPGQGAYPDAQYLRAGSKGPPVAA